MKKHTSSLVRLAAMLSATALVAAGCANASSEDGEGTSDSASVDYTTRLMNVSEPSGEPVKGGTLRVAEYSEARTLNPTQTFPTGATGGNIMAAVYDTLVRYDHTTGDFVPQLAESLESDDDKTWTLKLREGVKFHDGTPVNAEAVIGSLNYYMNSYGMNAALLKGETKSLEAVDPLTVEITVKHAWPTFPYILSAGAGMVMAPAAIKDPEAFKPIGAGPFKFKSYSPTEKTVVVANEDYWNGRPHLDSIEFVLLGADSTAYESLQSGGVDVAFLRGTDTVDQAIEEGVAGMVNAVGLSNNFWINARKGSPGEDQRVRKAIALAIDPELYLKRLSGGAGNATKLLVSPDSQWAPDVDPLETDPEAAKKLLDEAKADGFDGKVRFLARTDQASQAGAVAVQAMLEDVGFEVELDLVQNVADQTQKLYIDHDFDIASAATSVPDEGMFTRMMSMLESTSALNVPGFNSPEWDKLARELQGIKDPAEGKEVLAKMEEIWAEEAPGVGISSGAMINAWNDNVHGIIPGSETITHFEKTWLEK